MTTEGDKRHEEMVSLRQYVEALIDNLDIRYSEKIEHLEQSLKATTESIEKATKKAEAAAERRFESVNEFRGMLNDVVRTMIPRAEAERLHDSTEERITGFTSRLETLMPRAESDHRYTALNERVNSMFVELEKKEATGYGMQKSWGILAGVLGLVATVIATFFLVLQHITH